MSTQEDITQGQGYHPNPRRENQAEASVQEIQEEEEQDTTQTSSFGSKGESIHKRGREDQPLAQLGDDINSTQERKDYADQDEFLDNEQEYERSNRRDANERDKDANVKRRWNDVRVNFMLRHHELDDNDITYGEQPGDFDAMLGRLQEKTGKDKEQLRNEILHWNTEESD